MGDPVGAAKAVDPVERAEPVERPEAAEPAPAMPTAPGGGSVEPSGRSAEPSGRAVEAFNSLPEGEARARLGTCLAVPRWVDDVLAGRPYSDLESLWGRANQAAQTLSDAELSAALARHPRIGERPAENGHDAALSRREQAGVDPSDAAIAERLAQGNRAYEDRFDRVFLIRAAGRTAPEILGELERRLQNDQETERGETVDQLREIALLRLRQVV